MHWLDPDYLPATTGTLERFVLNPHGEVDGLLLADGSEIHTPPHLSHEVLHKLEIGNSITVRGVKPLHADVIVAIAIESANGKCIVDRGPPHEKPQHGKHPPAPASEHQGVIRQLLHGPKGNVHGALLQDGVIVRFPPHCASACETLLVDKAPLTIHGPLLKTAHGVVIDAHALGNGNAVVQLHTKPPKPAHKKPKEAARVG
jgi:hypothetical protein